MMMSYKLSSGIISSTPHPRRDRALTDLCTSEILSPIIDPFRLGELTKKSQPQKSKLRRIDNEKEEAKPKKRKPAPKDKVSASDAVLKELGVNKKSITNALSQSRNMFNLYPEPIVLDSDEEGLITSTHRKSPERKVKPVKKLKAETLKPKRKECEKPNKGKTSDKKSPILFQNDNKESTSSKIVKKCKENLRTVNGGLVKRVDQDKKNICPKNGVLNEHSQSVIVIKDSSSLVSEPETLSASKKKENVHVPLLTENDIIKWTPRRKKTKSKAVECVSDCDNNIDHIDEAVSSQDENISVRTSRRNEKNNLAIHPTTQPQEAIDLNENTSPFECCSSFQNIIFKHNKLSGGIVASCLRTDSLNLGYVEIEPGKEFKGTRLNVTFVVLEGQVRISVAGSSKILSAGDMLYIKTGSVYKFTNDGSALSRLLYIKEKL